MPDAAVIMRQGEKLPLYGQVTADTGTLTISGQPTFTLYDSANTAVGSLTALNVTGYDHSAAVAPRAWYVLDTMTPVALAVGNYTAVFILPVTSSEDAIARVFECSVDLRVDAPYA